MILGGGKAGARSGQATATLDGLLRRAAASRPDAPALADAANRDALIGGAPRTLTWAELDRLVDRLAGRLRELGLQPDTVVATQFPLCTEAVASMLAIARAGLIAAPLPLGWGRREVVAHLKTVGARAILTCGRAGPLDCADMMRFAAAEVFSIRFVLSLGGPSLDGVVPLDDVLADTGGVEPVETVRAGEPAHHVVLVTAEATPQGHVSAARSHAELAAGGLAGFMTLVPDDGAVIAATLAPDSFAGMALQVVPWLMAGCRLIVHPPFAPRVFADLLAADGVTHVVIPAGLAACLAAADAPRVRHALLVARRSSEIAAAQDLRPAGMVIDTLFAAGEAGIVRTLMADGTPAIRAGADSFATSAGQSPVLVETRAGTDGMLELAGAMVPRAAFPPGAERGTTPGWTVDAAGFRAFSQSAAPIKGAGALAIGERAQGIVAVGGRGFSEADIRAAYAEAGGEIAPVIRPDPVLGQRVSGVIGDGRAVMGLAGRLEATGLTMLAVPGGNRRAGPIPFEDTRVKEPAAARDALADTQAALEQLLQVARSAAGR
ncbi:AMP-binding protein [Phreatobacter sp.]|uniref:AMP-binding protein n=1 Tax=Phreatobacter sp. TaxID=1966341 RepID=UPI003F6E8F52